MGKNRLSQGGATKNQNKCSVFPAAYKLGHLHTNFILKHLNKNPTKPSKIKHFINLSYQTPISHPISSNPTKINTFIHHTTQIQLQIQTIFFLYKYKNTKKNLYFHRLLISHQIYLQTHIQIHINFLYLTSENYYLT